jgi:hypothetical protein
MSLDLTRRRRAICAALSVALAAPSAVAQPAAEDDSPYQGLLEQRRVDYSAALRKAALRLTGDLPTLAEIRFVADARDQAAAYAAQVDQYLADPRFASQVFSFFRDTFRMGATADLDTAPAFAAQLVVEERPFTELFTATEGNCPTFDADSGRFNAGECDNGVPAHAGVLTNPGVMAQFTSNLAFRRARWVQEVFACSRFPAEFGQPIEVGAATPYASPWPFDSIASTATGGRVDFLDVSSVVCANCHATMNHVAPLFGQFDEVGRWQPEMVVKLPVDGSPAATIDDFLPPGRQETAWRFGEPAEDLPALGRRIAADPDVAQCMVARVWNWSFGKGDIVNAQVIVPPRIIADHFATFVGLDYNLKAVVRDILNSDDFVRF